MRILFVHPMAQFAVSDVARGYRNALVAAGHDVRDYRTDQRTLYHARAIDRTASDDHPELAAMSHERRMELLSRLASEEVTVEAMYHHADVCVIASGLAFHPNGMWLLRQLKIPTVVLLTESPYEDEAQARFMAFYPEAHATTHERISAARYGWTYLPHAYDPAVHFPVAYQKPDEVCDVIIVGTGWPERLAFLSAIDWTGIDLRIRGIWDITADEPLGPFYYPGCIENRLVGWIYGSAKVCVNLHRAHPDAESLNPRAYELAACGACQISDVRAELPQVFGDTVPTFRTPQECDALIRELLADDEWRFEVAASQRAALLAGRHTFTDRLQTLGQVIPGLVPRLQTRPAESIRQDQAVCHIA